MNHITASLGGLLMIAYLACVIGIVIFLLRCISRFVTAMERIASSMDVVARKLRDESKP